MLPPKLAHLQAHCAKVYSPEIENFTMRTEKSFITEGGPDPLDYIYIFKIEADEQRGIPQHWHYIGFGLSDIYNYYYLYVLDSEARDENSTNPPLPEIFPKPNGFGFELTFRIKCDSPEDWKQEPPKWPAQVMQALAKYVFHSKSVFNPGDHIAWHHSLNREEDSRIKHMLLTIDPHLKIITTSGGPVTFVQLVGVCHEELQAAREWNVNGVLELMKSRKETGLEYLVTDMRRGESIFELDPGFRDLVADGIKNEGSDMVLISTKHKYSSRVPSWFKEFENSRNGNMNKENDYDMHEHQDEAEKLIVNNSRPGVERGNFATMARDDGITQEQHSMNSRCPSQMSCESESLLMIENVETVETRLYDNVYLLLSYESAKILPIVLNGRLAHKRQFTFQNLKGDLTTSFIPEGALQSSLVSREQPMAKRGTWLQIYVSEEMRQRMLETIIADFGHNRENKIRLPKTYSWPEYHLYITVVEEVK